MVGVNLIMLHYICSCAFRSSLHRRSSLTEGGDGARASLDPIAPKSRTWNKHTMSSPAENKEAEMPTHHDTEAHAATPQPAGSERSNGTTASARPSWEQELKDQEYERFDEQWLEENQWFVRNNVVHETLRHQSGIADYKVYIHPSKKELVTVVHFGEALAGHPGVVHGGIISTIFDNSYGWLYFLQDVGLAFTANLKVDFRRPIMVNSTLYVHVKLQGIERRKLIMDAIMESEDHVVHAESSTIFVIARKQENTQQAEATAKSEAPAAAVAALT